MRSILVLFLISFFFISNAQELKVVSPNKKLEVVVHVQKELSFSLKEQGKTLIEKAPIGLRTSAGNFGVLPEVVSNKKEKIESEIKPVVPLQNAVVNNNYNKLQIDFKKGFTVEFRVFNDGIAYRFITSEKDYLTVKNEKFIINLKQNAWVSWANADQFKNDYQVLYKPDSISAIEKGKMSTLPLLFKENGYRILFSEANLYDYPAMFLKKGTNNLEAIFPKVPLSFGNDGDRSVKILKEADYIAKTSGSRVFPWRFMVISKDDKTIAANEMVTKLSEQPKNRTDFSWVTPGQVTWEWWHNAAVYHVDFKSGYNQKTYEYYIDFASEHEIPYIIMDEGWAKSTLNPFEPNPDVNLHELIAYGKEKNVSIILWFTWLAVEQNFDVFKTLEDWGIAGMKIDFMDRSDQWMVNYNERVAREASKHKILIDFHGAFKPAGLEIKYPNVLSYEAVAGMEGNIFSGIATPNNNLYLPFVRNAVGPMDYTPGAMFSAHPKDYRANWTNTMSIGTRAHQLAMYIVFKSGLQMLADNPVNYLREKESLDFITSIPVTWDKSVVLEAESPEYILVARKKGDSWFIGGMTNSTSRDLSFKTDFLDSNKNYHITIIKDGINADVQAMDYKKDIFSISAKDTVHVKIVADGGYVARIDPEK